MNTPSNHRETPEMKKYPLSLQARRDMIYFLRAIFKLPKKHEQHMKKVRNSHHKTMSSSELRNLSQNSFDTYIFM